MADLTMKLCAEKRWWFPLAYHAGLAACVLRLLTEEQAERYVAWMVDKGVRIVVK